MSTQPTKQSPTKYGSAELVAHLPEMVQQLDSFRGGSPQKAPVDISLSELVQEKFGMSFEAYLDQLGVNTKTATMQNLFSMSNNNYRWLVPEILREAVKLGLEEAPLYPNLIASDQPVKSLTVTMPFINQAEATPDYINEGETIPVGTLSFDQKSITLAKIGKGFKLTDEVRNYVSLDVLAHFVKDFGIQIGYALDNELIKVLINGNQSNGSESAPVIGVTTPNTPVYKDLLRLWVRGSLIGRSYTTMVGGEDMAISLLDLPEFKLRTQGTPDAKLNINTPIPNAADFMVHGGISKDQIMLIDPRSAAIKLTARALSIEAERMVSNQTSAIYLTTTTGFSKMYMDSVLVLDQTQQFTAMPTILDKEPYRNFVIGH